MRTTRTKWEWCRDRWMAFRGGRLIGQVRQTDLGQIYWFLTLDGFCEFYTRSAKTIREAKIEVSSTASYLAKHLAGVK